MLRIKRTYDPPAREDGHRILVERLWPRGMTKVAPSTALRRWFNHQEERWEEFRRRYRKELAANAGAWQPILDAERRGTVTLLYSAHDVRHNGALVLRDYLVERAAGPRGAKRQGHRPGPRAPRARKSTANGRAA
jgi:uncharacterized protein YeaO (DUF488 family)